MNPQVALRNEHLGAEQSVPNDNTILHNFYKTKSQLAFPKQNKNFSFDLKPGIISLPNPRRQNTFATPPVVLLLLPLPAILVIQ